MDGGGGEPAVEGRQWTARAVDEDERDDGASSVEEHAEWMARRRSWTAAASRGTAVTGGTAAAGDVDESERGREGIE